MEEQIENAKTHYESLMPKDLNKDTKANALKRMELLDELYLCKKLLTLYRVLKAKGKI